MIIKNLKTRLFLILVFLFVCVSSIYATEVIWIEGEDAVRSTHSADGKFSPRTPDEAANLSGGKWLNVDGYEEGDFAEYEFETEKDGIYFFYIRKFWHHGPFRWKIDDGEWHTYDYRLGFVDTTTIRKFVTATWVNGGSERIKKGKHTLRIEMIKVPGYRWDTVYGIDALILADAFVVPSGKTPPGGDLTAAMPGYWAFDPKPDHFGESPIDLSYLNEDVAGQDGYVYADGDDFRLASGERVRFWSVNIENHYLDYETLRYMAKQYARLGINQVRLFWTLFKGGKSKYHLDEHLLHTYHAAVAAFKEEGIYVMTTPYFTLGTKIMRDWGVEGFPTWTDLQPTHYLLFFHEELQEVYRQRVKKLLTTKNKYTGIPLAEDPTVAIYQIQNEDSFFWGWDSRGLQLPHYRMLKRKFGAWLLEKYGSHKAIYKAWDTTLEESDENHRFKKKVEEYKKAKAKDKWYPNPWVHNKDWPQSNEYLVDGLYYLSPMRTEQTPRRKDTLEFLLDLQTTFNTNMMRWLREEIGYKGMISSCNWRGGFGPGLHDVERATYRYDDVVDNHHYFSSPNLNPTDPQRGGWDVLKGDFYKDLSALYLPAAFPPPNYKHLANKPAIITESLWSAPNKYEAESPFLISVYGAFSGLDGFHWFATYGPGYMVEEKRFSAQKPSVMGQFPAAALMFRKNYIKEGPVVIKDQRTKEDLIDGIDKPAIAETIKFDPNRDAKYEFGTRPWKGIDEHPFAYLVGRVQMEITNSSENVVNPDYRDYIDAENKIIKSMTGEIILNYGDGIAKVNTPKAQAITGHFKGIPQKFSDVMIETENEFVSVMVVSLDGEPLDDSEKILVQAMTICHPYGWKVKSNQEFKFAGGDKVYKGYQIVSKGKPPRNVKNIHVKVTFKDSFDEVTVLDEIGYVDPKRKASVDGNAITLPVNAIYTIVTR